MKWFRNLNIGTKLAVGFTMLVIVAGTIGVVGMRNIQDIAVIDRELYEVNTMGLANIAQAAEDYQRIRVNLGQAIMEKDKDKLAKYAERNLELLNALDGELAGFEKNIHSNEVRAEFNKLKAVKGKWAAALNEALQLVVKGDQEAAHALHIGNGNQYSAEIGNIFENLIDLETKNAGQKSESNALAADSAIRSMLVLLAVGILAAIVLALLITRQITTQIKELRALMSQVEAGDLTVRGRVGSKDEMGQLTGSFNHLISAMCQMTKDIHNTTLVLNNASNEMLGIAEVVAANSQEMSAVATGASAAATDIAAAIKTSTVAVLGTNSNINSISVATEEISATIQSLASASEQASVNLAQVSGLVGQISGGINIVAGSAKDVYGSVANVATAVKEINISLTDVSKNCESSINVAKNAEERAQQTTVIITKLNDLTRKIGKIVGLINDIADQTNMLALNAAIEAAGAGEAGKGFAVVANEVKELAKQTARATDDIASQIETMQAEMADAVNAVAGITEVISNMNANTNNIAASVTEQSAVVGDISAAIIAAAKKVELITNEISDSAEKSQTVAKSTIESTQGVKDIARAVTELSVVAGELAKNTENASSQMDDVAKTSQEISVNVEEISRSIGEMSIASNDTAARGSETRMAADELVKVSAKLEQLIKRFKI